MTAFIILLALLVIGVFSYFMYQSGVESSRQLEIIFVVEQHQRFVAMKDKVDKFCGPENTMILGNKIIGTVKEEYDRIIEVGKWFESDAVKADRRLVHERFKKYCEYVSELNTVLDFADKFLKHVTADNF